MAVSPDCYKPPCSRRRRSSTAVCGSCSSPRAVSSGSLASTRLVMVWCSQNALLPTAAPSKVKAPERLSGMPAAGNKCLSNSPSSLQVVRQHLPGLRSSPTCLAAVSLARAALTSRTPPARPIIKKLKDRVRALSWGASSNSPQSRLEGDCQEQRPERVALLDPSF